MVGSRFCELYNENLIGADFEGKIPIDITKAKQVDNFFSKYNFDWLILFSAFTDVDSAEKQRKDKNSSCWRINVVGVENIVKACIKYKRKLIFISTDFVFDGQKGPYSESDIPGHDLTKVSWYGISKIEAEKIIQKFLKDFIILRIAYPYRANFTQKDDIAKRILKLYKKGALYPMFYDQKITPTFIDDIPKAVKLLIAKNQKGIFHLASPKVTSQYEFAKRIVQVFGGDPNKVAKSSIKEFLKKGKKTPRPIDGGLKVSKISNLGFKPTIWIDGIEEIFIQSKGELI